MTMKFAGPTIAELQAAETRLGLQTLSTEHATTIRDNLDKAVAHAGDVRRDAGGCPADDRQHCGAERCGHPAISVPVALRNGLPVGMMPVGRHFQDAVRLHAAAWVEALGDWQTW